ncbi:MAG: CIA30 family protein [Rhodospirillaceae bacterium]|nr:CIA30 family protein [Rhodospirillaceae bacterium]
MQARSDTLLVDDFADSELISALGTKWRGVSDKVMGGVSIVRLERGNAEGRAFLRLKGDVRLENNGGFVQAALDLEPSGGVLDASGYRGLRITVRGNSQKYSLHLRTSDATLPWQSYRAHFFASDRWQEIDIPFADFVPYRIDKALDTKSLKRIGVVAIGRAFSADVLISNMYFYE